MHRAGNDMGASRSDVPVAIDALIFTPDEFAQLTARSSFGKTIAQTMRPIYAT